MSGLKSFLDGKPTLDELRSKLASVDQEYVAAQAKRDHLHGDLERVYLEEGDAAIAAHHARLSDAEREVDRLRIQRRALSERTEQAVADAEVQAREQRIREAEAAVAATVAKLTKVYAPAAAKIADFLTEWGQATALVRRVNADLESAGDPRRLSEPNAVARFKPGIEGEEQTITEEVWMHRDHTTGRDVPVSVFTVDPATGRKVPASGAAARLVTQTRTVPGTYTASVSLRELTEAVELPPATPDGTPFWPLR